MRADVLEALQARLPWVDNNANFYSLTGSDKETIITVVVHRHPQVYDRFVYSVEFIAGKHKAFRRFFIKTMGIPRRYDKYALYKKSFDTDEEARTHFDTRLNKLIVLAQMGLGHQITKEKP